MKCLAAVLAGCLLPALAGAGDFVRVPGGTFRSAVRYEDAGALRTLAGFDMMVHPVSNDEFARFLARHPEWQRDRVPQVFAGADYLRHWERADAPGADVDADAPVIYVSWYAATAYCRDRHARLPTFLEWEYAAAADADQRDARGNAAWRALHINDGTPRAPDAAASAPANVYGIYGLHGAVWEWNDDFSALLGSSDARSREDGERIPFCGAGALAFHDRQDYGVQKRFAVFTAVKPGSTIHNLGFRCARSLP